MKPIPKKSVPASGDAGLAASSWQWLHTLDKSGEVVVTPSKPDKFTLKFHGPEGRFSLTTDCNTIMGTYKVEGNRLTFGHAASTRMFCPESQEDIYSKALLATQTYTAGKRELRLSLGKAGGTMVFTSKSP